MADRHLTPIAQNFLAKNPTLIVTYYGAEFYEYPVLGDEAPLVCITPADGYLRRTPFWDKPTEEEALEWLDELEART